MIIAILVGIALPSYNHIMLTAHRADGKIGLLQLAAQLEKGSRQLSEYSPEGFYQLTIIQKKLDDYLIAAIPVKSQRDDKICNILAMNALGQKGVLRGNVLEIKKQCW